jgi:hypothetical protein
VGDGIGRGPPHPPASSEQPTPLYLLFAGNQLDDLAPPNASRSSPMSSLPVAHLVGAVWGWRVMCSTSVGLQFDHHLD